jgi:chromosome segregation ATPase
MSTAGKVLTVIVILAIIGWIFLFSKVADLNKNWGERIAKLTKDVEKLEADLPVAVAGLDKQLAELTAEQVHINDTMTVFRARVSDLEKLDSESREALDRIKFQLASSQASVKSAQTSLDFRKNEYAQTDKDLAAERAKVETLKTSVAALMGELAQMRDQFKSLLAENKQMLEKIERKSTPKPRVSSATLRQPAR